METVGQLDRGACEPAPHWHHLVGGLSVHRENLMSGQRYSFSQSVEVSFWVGANPSRIQQELFLAVLDGFFGPGPVWPSGT